ncbi:MAG: LytR/AlgR family response regulator transcription factor, partial [Salibacteraceae bacterium]
LLFLDIQMPKKTGFDLLREIKTPNFQTIFVSAHESYAVEAVKFHAMAYLLKPVMAMDLVEAVKLAEKAIEEATFPHYTALMLHFHPDLPQRIAVPTGAGHQYFAMDEIIRIEASKSYSNIYTTDSEKPILVSRNLKQFDQLLTSQGFQRVHNGHLVNLRHIKAYLRQDGGGIVLSDGFEITIGRHYRKVVMEVLRSMTLIV